MSKLLVKFNYYVNFYEYCGPIQYSSQTSLCLYVPARWFFFNCCIFWYLDYFNVLEGVMVHSCVLSQDLNYYILQSTLLFMVAILGNAEGLGVRVTACRPELTLQSWIEVSLCVWINRC